MIRTAIRAKLPLIAVHTRDPLNVATMLEHYSAVPVLQNPAVKLGVPVMPPNSVTVMLDFQNVNMEKTYTQAASHGSVVLFVNPEEVHPMMFDAGTVHLPEKMLKDFVQSYAPEDVDHYELEASLRGLSFKEMVEVARLAMAESGAFTADAVLKVRRARTILSSGLKLVDTNQHYYEPPEDLHLWLKVDGVLFTMNAPRLVRPRGLLFSGLPGTGKTSGAKFLAHSLKLPLYMLDVGGTLQKYVGDSEKNFNAALQQVETLAPCVLLLDEIEKVFDNSDDSGVSRRVLGMLLWWLQEHSSQVLTIMTTNDTGGIPPELVRPGRVDREMHFRGLDVGEAMRFVRSFAKSLTNLAEVDDNTLMTRVRALAERNGDRRMVTQAELTQMVIDLVKVRMVKTLLKE